jgi:hypothetical protein
MSIRSTNAKRSGLAVLTLVCTSGLMIASVSGTSGATSKAKTHHSTKPKKAKREVSAVPCWVGKWTVTNATLDESGINAAGAAGILADIAANGDVVVNFTPSAPLKGPGGTYKFSGNEVGIYHFTKTSATSGTLSTTYSSSTLTISINGGAPMTVPSNIGPGSYQCTGKVLSLKFPPGGNEVTYTLSPTK